MPEDFYPDDETLNVYEDYEEYVDPDEHERARALERRKTARKEREREGSEDMRDEYHYGEESGEAYEEENIA